MRLSVLLIFFSTTGLLGQEILPPEIQVKTALLAAPEELRENIMVYGYDESGELIVLQEGDGSLICLADDPDKDGIKVACYSSKLEPFMARGRELLREGKTETEKRKLRAMEVEAGKLKMPEVPSMLYVYSGLEEDYDKTTGELSDANFRYVVYLPYATTESTGLPAKPFAPGMPWLMDPGTHKAHIMFTPVHH